MGWFDSILNEGLSWGTDQLMGAVNWGSGTTVNGGSSGGSGGSYDFIPGLIGAVATAYTGYKSYESQRDASELIYEAAQSQVKAAGFQEQAAATQEMAALESQRLSEMNAIDREMQSAREVENQRMANAQSQSEARARAAASGVTLTGSTGAYLEEGKRVGGEQIDWMQKAGTQAADIIRQQGETAKLTGIAEADKTRAQAQSTRSGAKSSEAAASSAMAGAYGTAGSTANTLWGIGKQSNWF